MFVWLLVVSLGNPDALAVPGIASQKTCLDLGAAIIAVKPATVQCFRYRVPKQNYLTAE